MGVICKPCQKKVDSGAAYVDGEGPTPARFLVVGEAPGTTEDQEGRPFVGTSGRFLRSTLREIGGTDLLSDIYFTNAVHVRTGGAPSMAHIRACGKVCMQTILDVVEPEVIVCVGAGGLKLFTDDGNINVTKARHRVFQYTPLWEGATPIPVVATWSPSQILREADYYDWWYSDLVRYFCEEGWKKEEFKVPVRRKTSVPPFIEKADKVYFDVETTGLFPWAGDSLRTIAFSTRNGQPVAIVPGVGEATLAASEVAEKIIQNPNIEVVGANILFDLLWFLQDRQYPRCKARDVQYLHYLLDERYPLRGLKHLFSVYTNFAEYGLDQGGIQETDIDKLLTYNCQDVKATELVDDGISKELSEAGLDTSRIVPLMGDVIPVLAAMTRTGIPIDRQVLADVARTEKARWKESSQGMADVWARVKGTPWDVKILQRYHDLSDFLYKDLGLPVPKIEDAMRKDGRPSTSKQALEYHLVNDTDKSGFIKALFQYRAVHENYKKYVLDVQKRVDDEGRLHPRYNFMTSEKRGTVTGRLSVTNPAIHNIPNGHPMRAAFVPLPGDTHLVQIDLSTIELTLLAEISNDTDLINVMKTGEDLHQWAADTAHALGYPMSRKMAKIINFGILYGIGPKGLASQTTLDKQGAKKVMDRWFQRFKGVANMREQIEYEALRRGYVESPYGQRRNFPLGLTARSELGGRACRQAFNFTIQSAANMLNLMILADFARNVDPKDGFPITAIHDAIIISTPDPHKTFQWFKDYYEQDLEAQLSWLFNKDGLALPIRAEAVYGPHWGAMEPLGVLESAA